MEEDNKEELAKAIHEIQEENEKETLEKEPKEENKEVEEIKVETETTTPNVTEPIKEKKSKKKLIIIISIVVGVLLLVGILLLILLGGKKEYTVTFDSAGGTKYDSVKVKKGETVYSPGIPEKEGYTFICWELQGTCYSYGEVTKDITLKAKWEVAKDYEFSITYEYDNGKPSKTVKIKKGDDLPDEPDPTKEGYDFLGWEYDGYILDYYGYSVTSDMTLYAKWHDQRDDDFVVNFSTNGGSRIEPQTIKKGNKVIEPKDPTKEGYNFIEWQLNGAKYDFDKEVTSNLTLTAKWEENITVTFDSKGGSTVPSQKVKYGETVVKPADPTKDNATFDGWYLNDKKYNFDDKVTNSFTLTAKWIDNTSNSDEVKCTMKMEGIDSTMDATIIAHLDSNNKIDKVSYIYTLENQEVADLYCETMKKSYPNATCSGLNVTIPDATDIQAEEGTDVIGMTREQFITEAKKDDPSVVCN